MLRPGRILEDGWRRIDGAGLSFGSKRAGRALGLLAMEVPGGTCDDTLTLKLVECMQCKWVMCSKTYLVLFFDMLFIVTGGQRSSTVVTRPQRQRRATLGSAGNCRSNSGG